MKATHRLIDSVWTVEFNEVSPTEVEIIRYSREDPEGYYRERELPQCTVVEAEGRIFTELMMRDKFHPFGWVNGDNCDRTYKVVNPKHVFDYNFH